MLPTVSQYAIQGKHNAICLYNATDFNDNQLLPEGPLWHTVSHKASLPTNVHRQACTSHLTSLICYLKSRTSILTFMSVVLFRT